MQFEIVRPASSAIRELAPENYFYSQGYKLEITGLNTHDWSDDGVLIQKRFCSNCDHLETDIAQVQKTCPKCGDGSWSATTNVHTFVKLSGVKSFNFKPKSTLDDRSDERDTSLYSISRHLKFDDSSRQGAWGMKEIPFGIEYVKSVTICHVNLGLSSSKDANKVIINNLDSIPHHGFITCKSCGKSTSSPQKTEKNDARNGFHYGYCKNKSHVYAGKADSVFEEVFLFREISTEAIKILLPVQELDGESKVNLFKAGLDLGLKRYYKGNPQHLSIIDYKEYNEQNSRFDKYLVIHDNVSGGTGYLEKLFNPNEFTKVLVFAYNAIKDCLCKEKGKDGCYRCIYTYANQRTQRSLSRLLAEKLFEQIIQKSDSWESFNTGLGKLSGDGKIEESELEERFIRSLKKYVSSKIDEGYLFEEIKQNDVVNYKLQIRRNEDIYSYFIRPQHELGETQGVSNRTRSDFYIRLTGVKRNGLSIEDFDSLVGIKDIAVYLDGYTYHATKENFRFLDDIRKRESIVKSGSIMSWTLTWKDVELFDETDTAKRKDNLAFSHAYQLTTEKLRKSRLGNYYCPELFGATNSIERLIWYLKHPLQEDNLESKVAFYLLALQEKFGNSSCDEKDIESMLEVNANIEGNKAKELKEGRFFVFPNIQLIEPDCFSHKLAIRASDLHIISSIFIDNAIKSLPKESWGMFWRLYNLIQSKTIIHSPTHDSDS
jgi:DEAD/DEAH box helicase domain-containing protein